MRAHRAPQTRFRNRLFQTSSTRVHRVPLSGRAIEILEAARELATGPLLFTGPGVMLDGKTDWGQEAIDSEALEAALMPLAASEGGRRKGPYTRTL